jgi:erythronate-4-phosphate dehydrogenase
MKVVADIEIPYLKNILEPVAEVVYMPGYKISRNDLLDADALIIKSRTICNMDLLEGTNIKFIGTATSGYDHIDTDYCKIKNIKWVYAPGCNSKAVAQYVTSCILTFAAKYNFDPSEKTIGIIGVGQCGQKVERHARLLGMDVVLNDPPRARNEGEKNFKSLDSLLKECDIITFHPTLEKEGPEKTYHMADDAFFSRLKKPVFLINTSRGGVVGTEALKKAIEEGKVIDCALDCWENEPDLDKELLSKCLIATPHISGYSFDGKAIATKTILDQLILFFQLKLTTSIQELPVPENHILKISKNCKNKVAASLLFSYDPLNDTEALKASPENFEEIRKNYRLRRDYKAYAVQNINDKDSDLLKAFGFQVPQHILDKSRRRNF